VGRALGCCVPLALFCGGAAGIGIVVRLVVAA
jgi:hypothetical protein